MGWIVFLFVGLLAGWIAEKVMGRDHGLVTNLIVGVIGAYLGAFLLGLVTDSEPGGFWGRLIVAVIGACVLLAIVGAVRGRKT